MTQQLEEKVQEQMGKLSELMIRRRFDLSLNQAAISKITGLSQPQVSDGEKLKRKINIETFIKLADGLGLEIQLVPKKERTKEILNWK